MRCDPARMVSGDYYDYQDIGHGKLAFAIGDVAGKGISAALLMATLQAALRAQISQYAAHARKRLQPIFRRSIRPLVSQAEQADLRAHRA